MEATEKKKLQSYLYLVQQLFLLLNYFWKPKHLKISCGSECSRAGCEDEVVFTLCTGAIL